MVDAPEGCVPSVERARAIANGSTPTWPAKRRSSAEIVAWRRRGATAERGTGIRKPSRASRSSTVPLRSTTTVPGSTSRVSGASSGAKRAYAVTPVSTTAKPMTKLRRTGMRPMRANVRTVPNDRGAGAVRRLMPNRQLVRAG